jgi:hypothetical protein
MAARLMLSSVTKQVLYTVLVQRLGTGQCIATVDDLKSMP